MKIVYIAGPFRAATPWLIEQNIRRAEALALAVWQLGAAALCPHANTRFFQHSAPDKLWLDGDLAMLRKCDAILMTPDWKDSVGARVEHEFAQAHRIPIFYNLETFKIWITEINNHSLKLTPKPHSPESRPRSASAASNTGIHGETLSGWHSVQ